MLQASEILCDCGKDVVLLGQGVVVAEIVPAPPQVQLMTGRIVVIVCVIGWYVCWDVLPHQLCRLKRPTPCNIGLCVAST